MTAITVRKYTLPDSCLFENNTVKLSSIVWIPNETCVVMGRSNNPLDSLLIENVIADDIPIYKRPSGGETVLLSPKMIVLSVAVEQTDFKSGKSYFKDYNNKFISVLESFGIRNLGYKGISDITINDLKILGSSIYQNKHVVFYHAVLNVCESVLMIDRYLKHPVREPDYRKNRNHKDFITSIAQERYNININEIRKTVELEFQQVVYGRTT